MWVNTKIIKEDMEYVSCYPTIDWQLFQNATVFITGGTGLIGSTIINSFLYAGLYKKVDVRIIALVRDPRKAEMLFSEQISAGANICFISGAVNALPTIETSIDYIIHCASPTASSFFVEHPVETITTAVEGTFNILKMAYQKNVRGMIYLSSMEAYGMIETETLLNEDNLGYLNPARIRSCYPESKRICEAMCSAYAEEYKVPVCTVRLAQTFGPGVSYHDKRVFAMMARAAINHEDIVLNTKGTSKHPYLYSAQAVTAILTVLQKGKSGTIYNVTNPKTYCSIYEMGQMVAEKIACNTIKVIVDEKDASKYPNPTFLNLDISKIQKLGWTPDHDLFWMYKRLISTMQEEQ